MNEPKPGAEALAQKSDAAPALLGVACGLGAALFWALGFVATRHGLKVGFAPADLLMHRFLWSGLAFLPFVLRAGLGNLCGIGWGRGLVLMLLGGPVMSIISYTGFLFVPLGHTNAPTGRPARLVPKSICVPPVATWPEALRINTALN